jgi:hypothetical protein
VYSSFFIVSKRKPPCKGGEIGNFSIRKKKEHDHLYGQDETEVEVEGIREMPGK